MREAATPERAKDVVRSIIAADPEMMRKAQAGERVEVNINQISLLTPDYLRRALAAVGIVGASENEYIMLQEQYKAWDKACGNIDLTLGGEGENPN